MPGTIELPLLPEEAVALGPRLAVIETPQELLFMNASGPLISCSREDATAKRYIGAVFLTQGLAKGEDLAAVLGVHRSTLFRNQKLYREGGLEAVVAPSNPRFTGSFGEDYFTGEYCLMVT